MERLAPVHQAEPTVPGGSGSAALRVTVYGTLALMLAAGAWMRFNAPIAAMVPALAAPAALASQFAGSLGTRALVELPMVAVADSQAEVMKMGLSMDDAAQLALALRSGRMRLVRMPLVDAGAALPDGTGRGVEVSAGGYTKLVTLTRQPIAVTLPIGPVGQVSFRTRSPDGVAIGALGLSGPVRLPDIHPGQVIDVDVIAQ